MSLPSLLDLPSMTVPDALARIDISGPTPREVTLRFTTLPDMPPAVVRRAIDRFPTSVNLSGANGQTETVTIDFEGGVHTGDSGSRTTTTISSSAVARAT